MKLGEVRYSHFPLEEDASKYIDRPVIIVIAESPEIVVIKVTKTAPRKNDLYDVPIKHYKYCGLKYPSTARISKVVTLDETQIFNKVRNLHPDDLKNILQKLIEFTNQ
ncbi:MAG: type II toxin-antitoxin system PemK/MazF family toxin [Vulcanibacillus sp.]